MVKPYAKQVGDLLKKILAPTPLGLDESCLLYVGHWVLSLVQHKVLSGEDIQHILLLL